MERLLNYVGSRVLLGYQKHSAVLFEMKTLKGCYCVKFRDLFGFNLVESEGGFFVFINLVIKSFIGWLFCSSALVSFINIYSVAKHVRSV